MAATSETQTSDDAWPEHMHTRGYQPDVLDEHDPRDLRKALMSAEGLKQEGNDHFRAKRWDEALAAYRSALGHLPRRPQPQRTATTEDDLEDADAETLRPQSDTDDKVTQEAELEAQQQQPPSELDGECAKARAVLNANIGACYTKLGEPKEVVNACTEALQDDPKYIKALQRRAAANEQINSWSSLASAQEDYKTLLDLLPRTSPEVAGIRRTLAALAPRVEAAQKRETAEMLDKLKGLGNSLLGNFGLSTDNFQFVPNGQGGYSMNFVQDPR
ncbi:TPR-like protein [Dichomitus squalens]|uniref:TPR-like protein n=1 Tax=Dichomitus squalens TaxID=114155 RepID=A0A4Q9NYD1_9APHY|nr:TPR-like protein [Dichomitus squalens LYAD-421 SS1]EJF67007.1 TPR-like protein [Dichomitus squalens LYAD-421 SS1]TBU34568.1 TPR-like protein [Dichomitus squalens]TBU46125.1 TPR-like protein [Dichomitus squalens]